MSQWNCPTTIRSFVTLVRRPSGRLSKAEVYGGTAQPPTLLPSAACGHAYLLGSLFARHHSNSQAVTDSGPVPSDLSLPQSFSCVFFSILVYITGTGPCVLGYFGRLRLVAAKANPQVRSAFARTISCIATRGGGGRTRELRLECVSTAVRYLTTRLTFLVGQLRGGRGARACARARIQF